MDRTVAFYDRNAEQFSNDTVNADMSKTINKFLNYLHKKSLILDFGCGSGRDTKYMIDKGYFVEAVDGSEEICKFARTYTGVEVKQMLFDELSEINKYDGIWACASILHVDKEKLISIISKMVTALKSNGIIYTSFKFGNYEGYKDGRYFTYFNEESFPEYLACIENVEIKEMWITADVRPDRGEDRWLNLILKKTD